MDGPATNWSVFEKMSDQRKNDEIPCLENTGSCGLHTVSNALQNRAKKKNGWKLDEVLKSMWKLFQEFPARRDIYVRESKSTIFPMKFCRTCWVENVTVAERAISTWFSVLCNVSNFIFSKILLTIFKHSYRVSKQMPLW